MANPQIQANPQSKHLLDQMLEAVNMSPISLPDAPAQEIAPIQDIQAPQLTAGNETE